MKKRYLMLVLAGLLTGSAVANDSGKEETKKEINTTSTTTTENKNEDKYDHFNLGDGTPVTKPEQQGYSLKKKMLICGATLATLSATAAAYYYGCDASWPYTKAAADAAAKAAEELLKWNQKGLLDKAATVTWKWLGY